MLKMIYAADINGAIGNKGKLPWPKIGADMQRFRNATLGHACIMGRKTFESLPCVLDQREMLVVTTRYKDMQRFYKQGMIFVPDYDIARKMAPDAFVIGGLSAYKALLPYVQECLFTLILAEHGADVFMQPAQEMFAPPEFDCWEETQVDLRCRFFGFRRKT